MKYTPSVMVGSMSGTSGGTVASKWKGVLYVRRHVIPHNPKSAAQVVQRNLMARMSGWFRSLNADLVAKLNDLGSPCRLSGFNVMTKECLTSLAASDIPAIVPDNPECNSLFSVADATSIVDKSIDITWVPGNADITHFVHVFTCPVDPDETALEEPDGWTEWITPVLVSAEASDDILVEHIGKDYYLVTIVADTNDLSTATIISGGTSVLVTSGTTP